MTKPSPFDVAATCRYCTSWRQETRECRRRAPIVQLLPSGPAPAWPITDGSTDSCGDFSPVPRFRRDLRRHLQQIEADHLRREHDLLFGDEPPLGPLPR